MVTAYRKKGQDVDYAYKYAAVFLTMTTSMVLMGEVVPILPSILDAVFIVAKTAAFKKLV